MKRLTINTAQPAPGKLYFINNGKELSRLDRLKGSVCLIPDANLVVNLRKLLEQGGRESSWPFEYRHFLSVSRRQVGIHWHQRAKRIPVCLAPACLELSKYGQSHDKVEYQTSMLGALRSLYGVTNLEPRSLDREYASIKSAIWPQLPGFAAMFSEVFKLAELTPISPSVSEARAAIDGLLEWVLSHQDELGSIGGFPLYAAIYGLSGSFQGRKLLKFKEARKKGADKVAWNVAWDFMYTQLIEVMYFYRKYENNVFCTADEALADLLKCKVYMGPRFKPSEFADLPHLPATGEASPYPLRLFKDNPAFENEVREKIEAMLLSVGDRCDVTPIGFTVEDMRGRQA